MTQSRTINGFIIQGGEQFPAVLTFKPYDNHVTIVHTQSLEYEEIAKYFDVHRIKNGAIGCSGLKSGLSTLVFRSTNPSDGYDLYGCSVVGHSFGSPFKITVKFELALQQSSFDHDDRFSDKLKIIGFRQNFSYLSDWFGSSMATIYYESNFARISKIVPSKSDEIDESVKLQQPHSLTLRVSCSQSTIMQSQSRPMSLSLYRVTLLSLTTKEPEDFSTYRIWGRRICGLLQVATNHFIKPQAISIRVKLSQEDKTNAVKDDNYHRLISEDSDTTPNFSDNSPYLFNFTDIGIKGIAEWLQLCEKYSIDQLIYLSAHQKGDLPVEEQALATGVAIEYIGDQLCDDDDVPYNFHGQRSFNTQLEQILKQECFNQLLVSNSDIIKEWVNCVNNAYNGTKHRDRKTEAPVAVYYYVHECYRLLRYWAALRIGCPLAKIQQDIKHEKGFKFTSREEIPQLVSIFK
jgi:hypothetical protein